MQCATGITDFYEAQQVLPTPRCQRWPIADLPAATDQAERRRKTMGGGWPGELTLERRFKSPICLPRSADPRRGNVDQFLHDQGTQLLAVSLASGE